jgi:hypothetical protein
MANSSDGEGVVRGGKKASQAAFAIPLRGEGFLAQNKTQRRGLSARAREGRTKRKA